MLGLAFKPDTDDIQGVSGVPGLATAARSRGRGHRSRPGGRSAGASPASPGVEHTHDLETRSRGRCGRDRDPVERLPRLPSLVGEEAPLVVDGRRMLARFGCPLSGDRAMRFTPTEVEGVVLVEVDQISDDRGFFARSLGLGRIRRTRGSSSVGAGQRRVQRQGRDSPWHALSAGTARRGEAGAMHRGSGVGRGSRPAP